MAIGERMRAIRMQHSHSLDQAAAITGINRSTLHRLEQGETPRGVMEYVLKFAAGYRIEQSVLLDGETAKGRFESMVRKVDPVTRLELACAPAQERLKLLLEFIRTHFPDLVRPERLAGASGLPQGDVELVLRTWGTRPVDHTTITALAGGLHTLTQVSRAWLCTGWFEEENSLLPGIRLLLNRIAKRLAGSTPGVKPLVEEAIRALEANATH